MKMSKLLRTVLALILVACAVAAQAQDGHELWLRYLELGAPFLSTYRPALTAHFATFSQRPLPDGYQPKYPLDFYMALPPNAAPK